MATPSTDEDDDDAVGTPGVGFTGSVQQYTTPEARKKALEYLTQYDVGQRSPETQTLKSQMETNAENARKILKEARERILARQYDPRLIQGAIGAGMSRPGNSGSFSESLGNGLEAALPFMKERQQFGIDKEKDLLGINESINGIDTGQINAQLQMLAEKRKQEAAMAGKALTVLGREIRPTGAAAANGPMSTIEKNVRGMGYTPGTPEFAAQVKRLVDADVAVKNANSGLDANPSTPDEDANLSYSVGVPPLTVDPYAKLSTKGREKAQERDRATAQKLLATRNGEMDKIQQNIEDAKNSLAFNEHVNTSGWYGVARKMDFSLPYLGNIGKGAGNVIYNVGGVGDEAAAMDKLQVGEARGKRMPGERFTNYDLGLLLDTAMGRDKPYLTNKFLGQGIIIANQLARDHTSFLNDYYQTHGTLTGAENHWTKYLEDNPIYDEKASRTLKKRVGAKAFPVPNTNREGYKDYFRKKMEIPAGADEPDDAEPSATGWEGVKVPDPDTYNPGSYDPSAMKPVAPVPGKPLVRKLKKYAEGGQVDVAPMSYPHGLFNEIIQGASSGLSDEVGGESGHDRARLEDFSGSYPTATVGSQYAGATAGALAASAALKKLSRKGGKVGQTAGALLALAAKYPMRSKVALGGIGGGLAGAGAGDDKTGRVGPAVTGATLGMLFSPLGSTTARYLTRGARAALPKKIFPGAMPIADAEQSVLKSLERDSVDPVDLGNRRTADARGGIPSMVGDLGGPSTNRLTQAAASQTGPDSIALANSLRARQDDFRDRVQSTVNKGLKPDEYFSKQGELLDNLRTNAKPLYDQAFGEAPDISSEAYNRLTQTDQGKSAIDFAKNRFQLDLSKQGVTSVADPLKQLNGAKTKEELDRIGHSLGLFTQPPSPATDPLETAYMTLRAKLPSSGSVNLPPPKGKSLEFMNYVKQGLDRQITLAYGKGDSNLARLLKDHRDALVEDLDKSSPTYPKAREQWKDDFEVSNALESGRTKFDKLEPKEVEKEFSNLSFSAKDAYRSGAAQSLFESVTNPSQDKNYARSIVNSPATMDKLKIIFEKPVEYKAFKNALEREADIYDASSKTVKSADRSSNWDEKISGLPAVGSILGPIYRLLARPGGMGTDKANAVAKLLSTTDQKQVNELGKSLAASSKRMKTQRAVEDAAAAAGAVGSGAMTMPNPRGYMYEEDEGDENAQP